MEPGQDATRSEEDDEVTGEHEVEGATELNIPAFVDDDEREEDEEDAHTVQTEVPSSVKEDR